MNTLEAKLEELIVHLKNAGRPSSGAGLLGSPGRRYYNDMVQYITNTEVVSECNEVSIYNTGTSVMWVNGVSFQPGTGIAFDGKSGELDTTKYSVRFSGAGQNACFVIRKTYVQ